LLANAFKMLHQQRDGTSLGRIIGSTPALENFRDMIPPATASCGVTAFIPTRACALARNAAQFSSSEISAEQTRRGCGDFPHDLLMRALHVRN
jgi:hypothetical protein